MSNRGWFLLALVLVVLLGACGENPEPTFSSEDGLDTTERDSIPMPTRRLRTFSSTITPPKPTIILRTATATAIPAPALVPSATSTPLPDTSLPTVETNETEQVVDMSDLDAVEILDYQAFRDLDIDSDGRVGNHPDFDDDQYIEFKLTCNEPTAARVPAQPGETIVLSFDEAYGIPEGAIVYENLVKLCGLTGRAGDYYYGIAYYPQVLPLIDFRYMWDGEDQTEALRKDLALNDQYGNYQLVGADVIILVFEGSAPVQDQRPSAIPAGTVACNLSPSDIVTVSPILSAMNLEPDPRIPCNPIGDTNNCVLSTKEGPDIETVDMGAYRDGTPLIVDGESFLGPITGGEGWWWRVRDAVGNDAGWIRQELIYGCEPDSSLVPSIPPSLNRWDATDCYSIGEATNIECSMGYRTYPMEIRVTDGRFAPDTVEIVLNNPVVLRNVTEHDVTLERIKPDYAEDIPDMLTLKPGEIFTFSPQTLDMHIFRDTSTYERTTITIGGPY